MSSEKSSRFGPIAVAFGILIGGALVGTFFEIVTERYVTNNYFFDSERSADTLGKPLQSALDEFGNKVGVDAIFLHAYAPDHQSRKRLFSYFDRGIRPDDYKLFSDNQVLTVTRDQLSLLADHKKGLCSSKFAVHLVFLSEFITPFSLRDQDSMVTYPLFGAKSMGHPEGVLVGYLDWHTKRGTAVSLGKSRFAWRQTACALLQSLAKDITIPFERYLRHGGG